MNLNIHNFTGNCSSLEKVAYFHEGMIMMLTNLTRFSQIPGILLSLLSTSLTIFEDPNLLAKRKWKKKFKCENCHFWNQKVNCSLRVVLTTLIEILTEIMVKATPLGFIVSCTFSGQGLITMEVQNIVLQKKLY